MKNLIKFISLSMLGILLFMFPIVTYQENEKQLSILIAIIVEKVQTLLTPVLGVLVLVAITISAIGALIGYFYRFKNHLLAQLFNVNKWWLIIRIIGLIFVWSVYFNVGFSLVIHEDNGKFIFNGLLPTLFVLFAFAGMFLPLLLNYGLLEFVGVLLSKIMRPLFQLPGRAAVDCVTSWLGDGTLGVMLTSKQYEDGHYSEKEAAVIATTFSAVSITFCLVVLKQVGLTRLFVPYYITICVVGVICAIVIPRIPPLSKKSELGIHQEVIQEQTPTNGKLFSFAIEKAVLKAKQEQGFITFLKNGCKNILEMWMSVLPVVMAIGTLALIISNSTPFFEIIGKPIVPILELLSIPEATAASKTIFVGFADMFIPSIIAGNEIKSELTKFIVATVSVTQLIYMSEVGALIIGSKIPVKFKELLIIFIQRTIISLIIVTLIGRFILGLV